VAALLVTPARLCFADPTAVELRRGLSVVCCGRAVGVARRSRRPLIASFSRSFFLASFVATIALSAPVPEASEPGTPGGSCPYHSTKTRPRQGSCGSISFSFLFFSSFLAVRHHVVGADAKRCGVTLVTLPPGGEFAQPATVVNCVRV